MTEDNAEIKVVTLLKRRDGMSLRDFIHHYETVHKVIGDKYLSHHACGYRRTFLTPMPGSDPEARPDYDVVMEIDFPNQTAFEKTFALLGTPDAQAEIVADEEKLFDRSKTCSFIAERYESDLR
ncbi:MAG: EthD domain-containing protein [Pseudomonadota bacterium]